MTVERKYAMTKVDGGWLVISNDSRKLYLVAKYEEDGSAFWTDASGKERHIVGHFWGVQSLTAEGERRVVQRNGDGTVAAVNPVAAAEWACWDWDELMIPTRREAIQRAVEMGEAS